MEIGLETFEAKEADIKHVHASHEVWKVWTGRDTLLPWGELQADLDGLMRSCQDSANLSDRLAPELLLELQNTSSTSGAQEVLIRHAMRASPWLQQRWQALYMEHKDALYRYAMKLLQSQSLAETLFQELSSRVMAWTLLQEQFLERKIRWRAFLFKCIHRDAIALLKKEQSQEVLDEFCDLQKLAAPHSQTQHGEKNFEEAVICEDLLVKMQRHMREECIEAEKIGRVKKMHIWERRERVLQGLLAGESRTQIAETQGISTALVTDDCKHIGTLLLTLFE